MACVGMWLRGRAAGAVTGRSTVREPWDGLASSGVAGFAAVAAETGGGEGLGGAAMAADPSAGEATFLAAKAAESGEVVSLATMAAFWSGLGHRGRPRALSAGATGYGRVYGRGWLVVNRWWWVAVCGGEGKTMLVECSVA